MAGTIVYRKNNILEHVREMISLHPDRPAVISGDGKVRMTYRGVDERSNRLANALENMGIKKRDRVAIFQTNRWQYAEQYWALLKIGAVCVPMNFRLRGPQAAFILNECGAKVLLFEERYSSLFDTIRPYLLSVRNYVCTVGETPEWAENYENLLSSSSPEGPSPVDLGLDDLCAICFTSGTTGLPKGSVSTHRNILVNVYDSFGKRFSEGARHPELGYTISLINVPVYHIAGILTLHLAGSQGAASVIPEAFSPENFMQIIQREKVTTTYLVPTMFRMILDHPDFKKYDLSSLKFVSYGAMPMPAELLTRIIEEFPAGIQYMDAFGCTECNATSIAKLPEDHDLKGTEEEVALKFKHLKGIGRPLDEGIEVRIVDEEGNEVPPGVEGEVACRGDKVTPGYWRNPEANEDSFRNGWFYTGDMAWRDEDGYFYFADRKKDMINRGGENIFPVEVEAVLARHPRISEVAVFGLPDETWGTKVCAAVVPGKGEKATEAELIDFCKKELASYKCPSSIFFLDELPRTFEGGKVMRRVLRDRFKD